jgi:hypothetical protein
VRISSSYCSRQLKRNLPCFGVNHSRHRAASQHQQTTLPQPRLHRAGASYCPNASRVWRICERSCAIVAETGIADYPYPSSRPDIFAVQRISVRSTPKIRNPDHHQSLYCPVSVAVKCGPAPGEGADQGLLIRPPRCSELHSTATSKTLNSYICASAPPPWCRYSRTEEGQRMSLVWAITSSHAPIEGMKGLLQALESDA